MKIPPLKWVIKETQCLLGGSSVESILVYTGPHYDYNMFKIFSGGLELPQPHIYLGIGPGTHAGQTDRIMIEPDNIFSWKSQIWQRGGRGKTRDQTMPEEINTLLKAREA